MFYQAKYRAFSILLNGSFSFPDIHNNNWGSQASLLDATGQTFTSAVHRMGIDLKMIWKVNAVSVKVALPSWGTLVLEADSDLLSQSL